MISYDLAKKLKDAGFPQTSSKGEGTVIFYPEGIYHPTLSELVEACGEHIDSLEKVTLGWCASGTGETENEEYPTIRIDEYGSTPEEAVANLLLALKQK